jgi:hypothetical protein
MGSNLTATVTKLLRDAAAAIEATTEDPAVTAIEVDLPGMWEFADFTGGLDEVRPAAES